MTQNIRIGWLYPELMNIYGDRGNVIVLSNRLKWRKIGAEIVELGLNFDEKKLDDCDLFLMGGAQDKQQEEVAKDLFKKQKRLKEIVESGKPGLYICGAYQFLGNYYKDADGTEIKGLGIFDLYTENPGGSSNRLIGNISLECSTLSTRLLGFENHGGRTYLGNGVTPLGKVLKGFGNNGKDDTEGSTYKNSFGTYLHGPILPKNPQLTDYLIEKALEIKYKTEVRLGKLDDSLEDKARIAIAKRMGIAI